MLRDHIAEPERRVARAQAAEDLIEQALDCPLPIDEYPRAHRGLGPSCPVSRGGVTGRW
ncbi:hypothetical protein GCM10023096_61270 [Nonomuraea ferruginea]